MKQIIINKKKKNFSSVWRFGFVAFFRGLETIAKQQNFGLTKLKEIIDAK